MCFSSTELDNLSISGTCSDSRNFSGKDKNEKIAKKENNIPPGKKLVIPSPIQKRFPKCKWYDFAFQEWAVEYMKCKITYLGTDWLGDPTTASGEIGLRWSKFRQERNRAIVYSWTEQETVLARRDYYMVSLTVHHGTNNAYSDMVNTVTMLRECWKNVKRYINRKGWKFLRVMEPGEKNHYPHYHLVLCGVENESDVENLIDIWLRTAHKNGNNASRSAQDYRHTENVKKVGAYVAKYLSKTMEYNIKDVFWWRWMELCYRNGIRTFAMDKDSREFIRQKYPEKPKGTYGEVKIIQESREQMTSLMEVCPEGCEPILNSTQ